MSLRMHAFQFKGTKERQEDAYAFLPLVPSAPDATCAIGVFDGISCTDDPHLAAQHASIAFQKAMLTVETSEDLDQLVENALLDAHAAVLRLRLQKAYRDLAEVDKPATVGAIALVTNDNKVIIGHAGDTGVILRRDRQLYPLTAQHTNTDGAVERYLGQPDFAPDIIQGEMKPGDELIIGSDGALSALIACENAVPLVFFYKASESTFWDNATVVILTQTIESKSHSNEDSARKGVQVSDEQR